MATVKIIGRKKELALLDRYYHSGKAEFVALYGKSVWERLFLSASASMGSLTST